MGLIEELSALGVDVEDALARFMNNSALYEKMLKKLPEVVESAEVLPFVKCGDYETALSNAHTLKGVLGNLSIKPLYESYSDAVRMLRDGFVDDAIILLERSDDIQGKIMDCIKRYT